jgi:geranylgeranyl transferase type-1 subunit beta
MNRIPLIDASGVRNYLLDKTQHIIGGFGKSVGEVPGQSHHHGVYLTVANPE